MSRLKSVVFALLGLIVLIGLLGAAGSDKARSSDGPFPPDFPKVIAHEIMADIDADPDPSGSTAVMSAAEAAAITTTPDGRSPLDICRARRSTMIGYLQDWPKMSPAQRQALAAASEAWGEYPSERCSYAFDEANGFVLATRKTKERQATEAVRTAIVNSLLAPPNPSTTRQISADQCQWWQDEADRDRREAGRATTRDLREGWDHNEQQAANAYREFCR